MISNITLYYPDENHMMLVVEETIDSLVTETQYLIEETGTMELSTEPITANPEVFEDRIFVAVENAKRWLNPLSNFPPCNAVWLTELYNKIVYKVENILT